MYLFLNNISLAEMWLITTLLIATPFNNFCPKTLSNLARLKKVFKGFIRLIVHRTSW